MSGYLENLIFSYAKTKSQNWASDQCLCFHYKDLTITLLPKSEISSLQPSSVTVQPGNHVARLSYDGSNLLILSKTQRQVFSPWGAFNVDRLGQKIRLLLVRECSIYEPHKKLKVCHDQELAQPEPKAYP